MNRLKATNSVAFGSRAIAPVSGTPQYATDGVPGSVPPTIWPAYAFNMIQEEVMAVIVAAGLTPDDTNWAQLLQAIMSLPGKTVGSFGPGGTLGSVGTTSWTVPANVYKVRAKVWSGGGGGGGSQAVPSAASGGGGGAYAEGVYTVTPGAVISVTAGAAGTPGAAGTSNAGANGGASSFGAFCSCTGGGQGLGAATSVYQASSGALGGATGANIFTINGTNGQAGFQIGSAGAGMGGGGGSAFCGSGSPPSIGAATSGSPVAGGGGGGANGGFGGTGGAGIVIIEY